MSSTLCIGTGGDRRIRVAATPGSQVIVATERDTGAAPQVCKAGAR